MEKSRILGFALLILWFSGACSKEKQDGDRLVINKNVIAWTKSCKYKFEGEKDSCSLTRGEM